jgi:hypothetical protein
MAEIKFGSGMVATAARVVDDPRDSTKSAVDPNKPADEMAELCSWVMNHVQKWRDHRRSNYELVWDHYERLWRGLWSAEDRNKKSERSTLVTPALGEAVENIVAEVEEAVMGRGDLFDMRGEAEDSEEMKAITDRNKANLKEDLSRPELPVIFTTAMGEALINAAVYGSGIGEIFIKKFKLKEITAGVMEAMGSQPVMPGPQLEMPLEQPGMPAMPAPAAPVGPQMPGKGGPMRIITKEVTFSYMESVNPRNFLIDPTARSVETALGVAVEEYVGAHIVRAGQKSGDYRRVDVGTSQGDTELGADRQLENEYVFDKVKVVRYYGLVPEHLLLPPEQTEDLLPGVEGEVVEAAETEEIAEILPDTDGDGKKSIDPIDANMVEAIIVIANDSVVLKAATTPYLMEDRPVVAFPWDIVPGRFWGRSVCEKGQVPQRVLDAELRARIDALAYVSAPMMGMDASKLPRGFQLSVKPGKSILTNGKPGDVLMPFHFGQLDQSTFTHSQQLDQMVQRATGSLDVISLAQRAGGDARPGAVSMMLSGIVKRHKRTLMNFIDRFYVPALRKIMWRNMQFCPERYTPMNWSFTASSTMGILQREYESQNLVSLMQTMQPESKEYKILLMGVIENTGLTHRSQIKKMIEQSITNAAAMEEMQTKQATDPMQQQIQQLGLQAALAEAQAKVRELNSRANLQDVKARNAMMDPQFRQVELATKGIYAAGENQDRVLERRLHLVDRAVDLEDIRSNERIAHIQSGRSVQSEKVKTAGAIASEAVRARAEAAKARADERARARETVGDTVARRQEAAAQVAAAKASAAPKMFEGRQARVIE